MFVVLVNSIKAEAMDLVEVCGSNTLQTGLSNDIM